MKTSNTIKPSSIPDEYEQHWYEGFMYGYQGATSARQIGVPYTPTNPYNINTHPNQHKWWACGFNDSIAMYSEV